MIEARLPYPVEADLGEGFVVHDPTFPGPRPAVAIYPQWRGQSELERGFARELARQGYVVLAADVYGGGALAKGAAEAQALMGPLAEDRARLRRRLLAAVDALRGHPAVDPARIGVMGYCFGGLCALEVARSGADVRGVVSFHGLFHRGAAPTAQKIPAKVLVLHGFEDPMARPDAAVALGEELTAAGADWQIHLYGGTMHAFTNPEAAAPASGTVHSPVAARRAWQAMTAFWAEALS